MYHHALLVACAACAACAALTWILSVATREYSWVDRVWSILPPAYVAWFAWCAGSRDARVVLVCALTALWGARLTYNFWRKGGYASGGEDYRWGVLRKAMGPRAFGVFNLVFIASYQNALLLLIALPAWAAFAHAGVPLGWVDYAAAALFAACLVGETVADEQQWRFQQAKKARLARGERVAEQFVTTGLFRYSRHPNFFCEQGMWWAVYLFSVGAGAGWCNATVAGAVLLTLLFQGSTAFTEYLTKAKYPEYAEYQRRTSRLIPWFPREG